MKPTAAGDAAQGLAVRGGWPQDADLVGAYEVHEDGDHPAQGEAGEGLGAPKTPVKASKAPRKTDKTR